MDGDSDNDVSDDDELLSEFFGSDVIPDTSSDGDLTVDSELEDSDDSFEEQSVHDTEDEYGEDNGVNGDDEDEDDNEDVEEINLPVNLKRYNPSSVNVSPTNKRRRPSFPDDFTHLEELLERTNRQITHIYDTVSRMQEVCEMSQTERCETCGDSLNETEQATQDQDDPEGTVPQPEEEAEPEELLSDLDIEPVDEGAQGIDHAAILAEQPAVETPLALLQPADPILAGDPNEMPEIAETGVGNHTLTMNNPTLEENHEEEDTFNPPVFHNFNIPVIPEAALEENPETVSYPPAMGNSSVQQNASSSSRPPSDSEIEEVVLVEMPKKTEVIVDNNKETVYYPALLGNIVPPDPETIAASISSESVIEKLVLIEVPVHPENIVENNPETLNNPIISENGGNQEPAAASFPSEIVILGTEESTSEIMNNLYVFENYGNQIVPRPVSVNPSLEGYLGDPRRNIMLPNFHLIIARDKPTPSCAACYLANLIFSQEILLLNSVPGHASRSIFMDHNKLSAIREYLSAIFPNCDLREQGKDWVDCLSAISFMIERLYTETEILTDRILSMPISKAWNIRSGEDEDEGPSQWFQEVRESVIREGGNFEQNAGANSEDTDNAAIIPDELVYLGDPSRNIQIPHSVLKTAKALLRPYLSAKYISLHLFPEETLIRSNVYGSVQCGLYSLDSNRMKALQEFLQNNYPEYNLEETGCCWKLCVTAINSCLQTLRQSPRNVID
uniref:BEN domain containing 2 n=1 Tax=Peromyscus maniculatus bairdii TaxID=230844 RepID=A0A8C8TGH6_PERMB